MVNKATLEEIPLVLMKQAPGASELVVLANIHTEQDERFSISTLGTGANQGFHAIPERRGSSPNFLMPSSDP